MAAGEVLQYYSYHTGFRTLFFATCGQWHWHGGLSAVSPHCRPFSNSGPLNNWNLNVVSYTPHATRNKTPGPLVFGMLLNLLHYRAEFLDSICQC